MNNNSIAVLKLGGLGDLLMASPAIRAYKKSFPKTKINFIIGISNKQVLKNNPYIDKIYYIDDFKIFRGNFLEKVNETLKLINIIKHISPDKIFVLHRDWRWNFISYLAKVKERYGFKRDFQGLFLTHSVQTSPDEHEIEKYLKIFSLQNEFKRDGIQMDIFPSNQDKEILMKIVGNFFKKEKVIAISPGGAANAKEEMDIRRWPIENYLSIAKKILHETNFNIVLIGGKNDTKLTEYIQQLDNKRILNLAGKTNIQQTYIALKLSKVLITHDSGPMHIGAAANIPVISLFGPTYPIEKYPITNSNSIFIWKGNNLSCSPCYQDGKFANCTSKECMYKITVNEVFYKTMEVL